MFLGLDLAQGFWSILIPHGLSGGALSHINSEDSDGDASMGSEDGWTNEFTQWWFEFLSEKGGKGVSKDTWMMVSRNRPREKLQRGHFATRTGKLRASNVVSNAKPSSS